MPSLTTATALSGNPSGKNGGAASSSPMKSASRKRSEERTLATSGFSSLSGGFRRRHCRRHLPRQPIFELSDVLEQPGAGEAQEVKTEGRILHVEFLDLAVADAEDDAGFDAFQRLRPHVRRRQH